MLEQFSLQGKVAIVTGASTGLGQGMAIGLAQAGATVVGVDYVKMTDTKAKIGDAFSGIVIDLIQASVEDMTVLISEVVKQYGTVDILVNNAGIIRRQDAIEFSEKNWDDVMNINAKKVFFLSQQFVQYCVAKNKGGKIINIASMLSFQGGIRVPSYTSSKSAVKGMTMAMANEWAKYGINVNAIAPGYMATNNTAALIADPIRSKAILERIPAGRWGTPKDVAGCCVFLASDNANYIHGYTIAVDGGWLAR